MLAEEEGVEDPREEFLRKIRSRFVSPSETVKKQLAMLDMQNTEDLEELDQSLSAKQKVYKARLDKLP